MMKRRSWVKKREWSGVEWSRDKVGVKKKKDKKASCSVI